MKPYLIHHLFDAAACQYSHKTAIVHGETQITYAELRRRVEVLANVLTRNGIHRGDRVGILLPKSIAAITAMLAVLEADAVCVPMDVQSPAERLQRIYTDCQPATVICETGGEKTVRLWEQESGFQTRLLVLDGQMGCEHDPVSQDDLFPAAKDRAAPLNANVDQDIACIVYTSGSTGTPKGVMISHLNLVSYIQWACAYFDIRHTDSILNTSPLHFDMSFFDVYGALGSGASLILVDQRTQLFPPRLIDIMVAKKITIWKAVASLLAYMVKAKALRPGNLPTLEKIIFSGEALPSKYLRQWMQTYPEKRFFNAYGPTEATGISTCHAITADTGLDPAATTVPIGKACANTEVFAVGDDGLLATAGETGELYIRGSGLSPGYWNDPERTRAVFVPHPLGDGQTGRVYMTGDRVRLNHEGSYSFIGRMDSQIKHMGHRIELGEIESQIHALGPVSDAAVVDIAETDQRASEIIAYVTLVNGVKEADLLKDLKLRLPRYMIPHKIHAMASLPRTRNGKVDRQALRQHYAESTSAP